MSHDKDRIHELIDAVMKVARGDYAVQVKLSGNNDDLDALAMGLNMMIDDLKNNVDLQAQNKRFKALNEELTKAKEQAQESDRLKSAFLANMSHEIRSPMNAIIGFSALLSRSDAIPEKHKVYFEHIINSGKQLLTLIDDIIDISKIESNQLKIIRKEYNLNKLLGSVYEMIVQNKELKSKNGVELLLKTNPKLEAMTIHTDQVRFKQIFLNLLNNAINFTDEGIIELGYSLLMEQGNKSVCLYVKDTGIGIPEDMQKNVFERFRQVHGEEYSGGAGLGLSITKGLVDLLGGTIRLESELGTGSVFYVNFPLEVIEN